MRDYRGRYSQKRMTAVDRIVVLGLATFTISLGWSISHFSETYAVASDLQAGQPAVQSEIVSSSTALANDEQTAGDITTPEPTVAPLTQKQEILNYIVEVFGDDAADAIVVIRKCENSSFNPRATNQNRNGSVDRGIFQLNSAYWGGEELYDWKKNVDVAYKVFTRAGKKWTPWTCAHVVDQKNYLNQ